MTVIQTCALPEQAFLSKYAEDGGYTDCFVIEMAGEISLAAFVEAFYTTWLFKLERALLVLAAKPSTDLQAKELAAGTRSTFPAWIVEERAEHQLLMCDLTTRTRSWFMIAATIRGTRRATLLFFGSAVTATINEATGEETIGPIFHSLMGFHRIYSKALLHATRSRLNRTG
ncbi:hypothetical protein [Mesorhizobium mediterraneum]|uniref:hypothetical protein n=1 Tax=Mesorhizobium mediterraneum TaxID=43617 RepID=UPI0017843DC1|nr:hypothetical protein [Mesorhizobium mediterraneum]